MNSSLALKTIHNNIKMNARNKMDEIELGYFDEKRMTLPFQIKCPDNTLWEGQYHHGLIFFPNNYPFQPPKVCFKSQVFHPNVYNNKQDIYNYGYICISILDKCDWSPAQTLQTIFLSILSLFDEPGINSPANVDANKMFMSDEEGLKMKFKNEMSMGMHKKIDIYQYIY